MFDGLVSLKRWHWMAIAILVGLAVGFAARPSEQALRDDYGYVFNDRADFEKSLVDESGGSRRFKDLVIHRQRVTEPDGEAGERWVINGIYCSGFPDRADGKLHWKPRAFVAAVPYQPARPYAELMPGAPAAAIEHFKSLSRPTPQDFLQLLHDTRGVQFTHAWWRSYAQATWLLASVVLLGIVWPTAIDLVYFGRLIRPREPKGIKLMASPAVAMKAHAELSAEERARLEALDAAMEAGLKAGASESPAPAAPAVAAAPVRKLDTQPQAATVAVSKEDRAFGVKEDDFYPTEQKAKPPAAKR